MSIRRPALCFPFVPGERLGCRANEHRRFDRLSQSRLFFFATFLLAACHGPPPKNRFPDAGRDVAPIVSDTFSTEDARDRMGEAERVMELAKVAPGMSVADVGAGEGYYTVRLAPLVGPKGRVLAEDIDADARDALSDRVQRNGLENVSVRLGTPGDPKLPAGSFDRIFLVHMYHEVTSPYAFLWHLRDGVRAGGLVVVVDSDRPVKHHGIPPALLACELRAVGLRPVRFERLLGSDVFYAAFRVAGPKPAPGEIKPCRMNGP